MFGGLAVGFAELARPSRVAQGLPPDGARRSRPVVGRPRRRSSGSSGRYSRLTARQQASAVARNCFCVSFSPPAASRTAGAIPSS